jgi:APA family basic amino acid/polyamine antiporter
VFIKLFVLVFFIGAAFTAFDGDNLEPFTTDGTDGIVTAASLIFFAYIGFDAISTSGEETKNPGRDLPIAIVGSLAIATILYCLVAVAASGALPFDQLKGIEAPLASVLDEGVGLSWGATLISIGALIAITSVVLTVLYGQTRIMFAMSRDGLVSERFSRVSPKTRTPVFATLVFGLLIAIFAAVIPLTEIVKLVNIGTLFAFMLVNIGIIVLRRTKPDLERGFRVPFVPLFPIIGILLCGYLMADLPASTWLRFLAWLALGMLIYVFYGRRHSKLAKGEVINPEAELPGGTH